MSHLLLSGVCTEPCKRGWCRPRLPSELYHRNAWAISKISIHDMNLKSINLRLQPHIPGASVLNKLCPKEVAGSATHWFDLLTAIMENAARLSTGDVLETSWKRYMSRQHVNKYWPRQMDDKKSRKQRGGRIPDLFAILCSAHSLFAIMFWYPFYIYSSQLNFDICVIKLMLLIFQNIVIYDVQW